MKNIFLIVIFSIILVSIFLFRQKSLTRPTSTPVFNNSTTGLPTNPSVSDSNTVTVIAENLDTPWGLALLPDTSILITERSGSVRLIDTNGELNSQPIAHITKAKEIGEGGLLGITLHPDFDTNHYVYFYYTYSQTGDDTLNRVSRMKYEKKKLSDEKIIVDAIPGASNHNGGRIKFGPDKMLYIGTGDAQNPSQAQNTKTLGGKILRVTDEGKIPSDNPFSTAVYTYGHRNVQGLTWDVNGRMWATEHGRSGILSGLDELNLIQKGKNYGWPDIEGDKTKSGMELSKKHSGGSNTWAPSGMAYFKGSIFFGGLRGEALYEAVLNGTNITAVKEHFKNEFGRIREVTLGTDNMLYISTSNQDGRGNPKNGDDKIIKINPATL